MKICRQRIYFKFPLASGTDRSKVVVLSCFFFVFFFFVFVFIIIIIILSLVAFACCEPNFLCGFV